MKKRQRIILIVDDESDMIKMLEKRLVVDGYRVINALDGSIAVKKAKEECPDLILSDLMMPNLNGTKMVELLNTDPETKDIPVVFITAMMGVENDKGYEEIEIEGEHYRIFAKPLHNRKLLSTIRKVINRRENS